ncbi:MAG: tRNA (adenosine(37)-N6)-dimethylallyltransferase MiaA, partial [Actinomycetota bacterium]
MGPTATGKTEASLELARRLEAEIVVVDSMCVYRGMDVGTAKPSPADRAAIPHHLVDVADPAAPFSVVRFQSLARAAADRIRSEGRRPFLVGGSGLYFRAVVDDLTFPGTDPQVRRTLEAEGRVLGAERLHGRLEGLDPVEARKIEPGNVSRTIRALELAAITGEQFSGFARDWERYDAGRVRVAGISMPTAVLRERIEARARRMLEGGLIEETERLLGTGARSFVTASQAIGYLEAVRFLEGHLSREQVALTIVRRTKDLARRQMAWFRKDPRIRWFEAGSDGAAVMVDRLEVFY